MEDEKKKKKNKKKKNKQQQVKSAVEEDSSNINIDERSGHNAESEATNGALSDDTEKQNWLQEEARLRDMVKQLLYEKDTYIQKQADLEMKIEQLQGENDSWHQKEVILEQRISQVLQQQASSSSEKRDLQEKISHIEKERALLVDKENSSKEMIAELNNAIDGLRMQVVELEGAKNSISLENGQLKENISTLHSQIQDLETRLTSAQSSVDAQKDASEKENLNAEIEAACVLVEKLVTENAELVEKMNELYMELSSRNMESNVASIVIPNHATIQDPTSTSNKPISSSTANTPKLFETLPIAQEQRFDVHTDYANHLARHSSEITVSEEIVQIPLDENEPENHDLEAQPSSTNEEGQDQREEEDVGLTDSPLIGAPFRLFSFVAKFVSGADLVDKSSSESV